jgi:class 3 adenylate cyclase
MLADRLIKALKFWAKLGTAGYAPRDARRMAVINVLSAMVSVMTSPYIVIYAIYDWRGLIIPILTLSPQVPLYAITPLWNRVGPFASAIYLSTVWVFFACLYSWYFGRETGLHYYFLPGAAASMLICGPRNIRYSALITFVAFCGFVWAERMFVGTASFIETDAFFTNLMFALTAPFAFLLVFLTVLFAFLEADRAEDELEREHDRSESLLRSMLPRGVAERLKHSPEQGVADALPSATVLFADIVSFTPRAARLAPRDLLAFLNDIFGRFDRLTAKHGLDRIKTIGDAYMAVGGIGGAPADHVRAMLALADDMQRTVAEMRLGGEPVELRIGIHTGPVLAGVLGSGRIAYDAWGDTVNLASRMEETAPTGHIQVTRAVVEKAGGERGFVRRGKVEVRGYGPVETWLVEASAAAIPPARRKAG